MKTAAFYSYKGGVGRSLFVANLSLFLARFAAKKVLTVDLDLEAPGLHYKYEETGVKVPPIEAGLVDTLHDYLHAATPPATLPILDLWPGPEGGSVHFFPAGAAPRTAYWDKLATMNFHELMRGEEKLGSLLFREVLEHIREQLQPDIVLIDARTGVTELGGAAAQIWAQQAFCMALDQAEHLEGIRAVMRGIARHPRSDGEGLIQVVPVLSRMHTVFGSPEEDEVRERVRRYLNEMGPTVEETLSIASNDEIVVLHNDDEVYRTGRALMGDVLGGARPPSRLLSDYFDAGLRFVEPMDRAAVGVRIASLGKADLDPLIKTQIKSR
ncbi:MAG: AAA family ATPase [Minicystis sp.]